MRALQEEVFKIGTHGLAGSGILQSTVPGREGDGGLETRHLFVDTEWIRHSAEVPHGDSGISFRVDKGDWMFSIDLKDSCPSGISTVSSLPSQGMGLISSVRCVSVCPLPHRCLPESMLWFRSGVLLLRYVDDWLVIAES